MKLKLVEGGGQYWRVEWEIHVHVYVHAIVPQVYDIHVVELGTKRASLSALTCA